MTYFIDIKNLLWITQIELNITYYDKLKNHNKFLQIVAKLLFTVLNSEKVGWFLTIDFDKK